MTRGKVVDEKIRSIIINLFKKGKSNAEIGDLVNLSKFTVRNIIRVYKTTGTIATKPRYASKSKISDADRRALKKIIRKNRRSNYGELSVLWSDAVGRSVSRSTCHREALKLGFKTYKVILLQLIPIFFFCNFTNFF